MPHQSDQTRDAHGRRAHTPLQIPPRGWWDVIRRVYRRVKKDTLSLIAAGVAFYSFLSLFPAIVALLSIIGLVVDPATLINQLQELRGTLPPSAIQLIQSHIHSLVRSGQSTLGVSLAVSVAIALYSASRGVSAMISALNIVYTEDETRGFIALKLRTLAFTLAGIALMLLLLLAIGLPSYLGFLNLPAWLEIAIRVIRWIVAFLIMITYLAGVFALAPDRKPPRLAWTTPGATLAAFVWLLASIGFSFYLSHFSSYNQTYGSAAAIVILLTWFWLSAFIVLIGAEVDAELEGQTEQDSTRGPAQERGQRAAVVADEVHDAP